MLENTVRIVSVLWSDSEGKVDLPCSGLSVRGSLC